MNATANAAPLVYCVVLNFNGKSVLKETLDTTLGMSYPNFKVVLVDNGSADGSFEQARRDYPSIVFIDNGKNLGFGEGNNVGIRYCLEQRADWVLLLNNDIVVDREMLTELVKAVTADEAIGMACPKIYFHSEPNQIWYAGGKVNFWTGIISHRGLRENDNGQYDRTGETEYVTGCAMMMKREAIEKVGMFDPVYYPAYTEDADLSERTRRAGYKLLYVPNGKLWHKVSSSSGGGTTPFKTSLKIQHNLIFFKRYASWYHWLTIPICVGLIGLKFLLKELANGNFAVVGALFGGARKALGLTKNERRIG